MFLIDTNVLSALRRRDRNPAIVQWIESQRTADLHISVVTVGEIERGITQQQRHNPTFARDLSAWLDRVLGWTGTATGFYPSMLRPQGGGGSCPRRSVTTAQIFS